MFKIKYNILFLIILVISSCALQKEILIPANKDDIRIEAHLLNNDIEALINVVYELPLKRDLLTDYILFDCNFENYDYAELIKFVKLSQADSLLHNHFQNIVSDREDQIIDHINSLSIIEIADYYRNTPTEL
ncbi:MAG: hypothetical protein SNJ29_16470 [Rikenellaceae bacterium]